MRICFQLIACGALFISGEVNAADVGQAIPIPATIEQLITSPDALNGKLVRVRGRITQCTEPQSCDICPEEPDGKVSNESRCLGVDFHEFGAPLLVFEMFRFATVVLDARFDTTCLKAAIPCTDNNTALLDARVYDVLKRHSALDAKLEFILGDLVPASPDDEKVMLEALNEASIQDFFHRKVAAFRLVNVDPGFGPMAHIDGIGCVGDGNWPKQWSLIGMNSPGNPFHCWPMRNTAHGWRVLIYEYE